MTSTRSLWHDLALHLWGCLNASVEETVANIRISRGDKICWCSRIEVCGKLSGDFLIAPLRSRMPTLTRGCRRVHWCSQLSQSLQLERTRELEILRATGMTPAN